jgi:hypothetical protein
LQQQQQQQQQQLLPGWAASGSGVAGSHEQAAATDFVYDMYIAAGEEQEGGAADAAAPEDAAGRQRDQEGDETMAGSGGGGAAAAGARRAQGGVAGADVPIIEVSLRSQNHRVYKAGGMKSVWPTGPSGCWGPNSPHSVGHANPVHKVPSLQIAKPWDAPAPGASTFGFKHVSLSQLDAADRQVSDDWDDEDGLDAAAVPVNSDHDSDDSNAESYYANSYPDEDQV